MRKGFFKRVGLMRRFYLHERKGVFYAELVNQVTKKKLTARSTGANSRDEALLVVAQWLKDGLPPKAQVLRRGLAEAFTVQAAIEAIRRAPLTLEDAKKIAEALKERGFLATYAVRNTPGAELLEAFIVRFWDYSRSPYVADKLAHGQSIGKKHCLSSAQRAKKYWVPFFKGKCLSEISREDVRRLSIDIAKPANGLSKNSLNRVLVVGTSALKWAYERGLISSDVTGGIMKFSGGAKKRGILTPDEAAALFKLKWPNERLFLANLLAATTGLRAGEIVALKRGSIGESVLIIDHAWGEVDHLKTTKTGETRRVPVMPEIRDRLRALADMNPHENGFVFWGTLPNAPMVCRAFAESLRKMLVLLKVGESPSAEERSAAEEYWVNRNVCFHSWRHFYASRMADNLDAKMVMRATGHATRAVFDEYADHALESDLAEIGRVSAETFGKILPFTHTA
jgi:integrase